MAKESAVFECDEKLDENLLEAFDFDELEEELDRQLKEELADMQFLTEEKEKIGSPDNLGNVVMDIVWEQFLNQVAATAGEDFIKENQGLHLDLRNEAHIQTAENFANGKIATHNTKIDYQGRYNDWQSNFVKDENGKPVKHKTRSGKEEATLTKDARKPFDEGRPSGSVERHTDMDHTISAAEIIRDPTANAFMTKEEQIAFANSESNLNEMDSSLNRSKGDKSMQDWLDNPNSNGQKPNEIFDISEEEELRLRQKDAEARKEYEKQKKEAEEKSIAAGKQSQKEEAFRIGGKALCAVLMQLLAELVKEIVAKLVNWFKTEKRNLSTLWEGMKEAIHSFVGKMKTHLINAGNTVLSTVTTAIIGPVYRTIKKVWMMLKQGWSSLRNAISYIKDPANKNKPIGILLMEVGKIVIAGLTGVGALLLGEVIEKGLMGIPAFAYEIPMIGSLANIIGVFFGAVVAGIIGALVINLLDKVITKKRKQEVHDTIINKGNRILNIQAQQGIVLNTQLENNKAEVQSNISKRHYETAEIMKESFTNIMEDFVDVPFSNDVHIVDEKDKQTNAAIDKISDDLDNLLNSL